LRESGGPSGSLSGLPFGLLFEKLDDVNEHHFVGKRDSDLLARMVAAESGCKHFAAEIQRTNIRILNLDYNLDLAIYDERGIDIGERRITTGQFIAIESNLSAFSATCRVEQDLRVGIFDGPQDLAYDFMLFIHIAPNT